MKHIFLDRFSKNTQISNFMKILPLAADFVPCGTDGQTDMTKLIVAFRNFAKAPKNLVKSTLWKKFFAGYA
jgi:hypothetical protein